MKKSNLKVVGEVTDGGNTIIENSLPYAVHATVEGSADMLFHRWNCESVDAKASAAKNSKAKKTDDIESYVWRNTKDEISVRQSLQRQSLNKIPVRPGSRQWICLRRGLLHLPPLLVLVQPIGIT